MSIDDDLDRIEDLLGAHRFRALHEAGIQDGIAAVLRASGIDFTAEAKLGPRDRIDFLAGAVGLEVKIEGSWADVARQLIRYAKHERVEGLLLATTRRKHAMPATLEGKPLRVVVLRGGFL